MDFETGRVERRVGRVRIVEFRGGGHCRAVGDVEEMWRKVATCPETKFNSAQLNMLRRNEFPFSEAQSTFARV